MSARRQRGPRDEQHQDVGPPGYVPEGPPPPYLHPDQHSFMLQTIGEMRESVGGLKQAVDTLTEQSREQAKKLDTVSHRMYAAGVVIAILLAVLGWIMNNLGSVVLRALDLLSTRTP